jgi:hypothetical protein
MNSPNHSPRWLALDGAVNARVVVPRVLLRADNLQSLSARDVRLLVDEEGLEVVLDLRTDTEVAREGPGPLTTEPAVRIEHRSLYPDSGGTTDLTAPWAREDEHAWPEEEPVVRSYVSYLDRRPDSIVGSVQTIARAEGAVLAHCAAGKDRTGVVVALALDAAGVDRELIVADFLATGERMDAVIERLITSPTYGPGLKANRDERALPPAPGTMERLLALVDERFGGSLAWLSGHGLTDADAERLRRRMAPAIACAEPRS